MSGAFLSSAVKLPLWIGVGVHGLFAIILSVMLMMRLTGQRTKVVFKDLAIQRIVSLAFFIEIISTMSLIAQALGQQIFSRFDTIDVNWLPIITAMFCYALLTKQLTLYLAHNSVWDHYLWMATAFGVANLLLGAFVSDMSRYVELAFGWGCVWWVIHVLWCYRRRASDSYSVFVLLWVTVCLNVGLVIPHLVGHAYLAVISFVPEVWWVTIFTLLGLTLPSMVMIHTIYAHGARKSVFAEARIFATRCREEGIPGDTFSEYMVLGYTQERTVLEMQRAGASSAIDDDLPLVMATMHAMERKKQMKEQV